MPAHKAESKVLISKLKMRASEFENKNCEIIHAYMVNNQATRIRKLENSQNPWL